MDEAKEKFSRKGWSTVRQAALIFISASIATACYPAPTTTPTTQPRPTTMPSVPRAAQAVAYERSFPVFSSKNISKEDGDALLNAFDGGAALEVWMKDGLPPGMMCVLPVSAERHLTVIRTDGTKYNIALTRDGGLAYLPDGLFQVRDQETRRKIAEFLTRLDEQLVQEVIHAPPPCSYVVGTVDDGGSLSGIARLFYGKKGRWQDIYNANREAIKNPDLIQPGMRLTMPEPKPGS